MLGFWLDTLSPLSIIICTQCIAENLKEKCDLKCWNPKNRIGRYRMIYHQLLKSSFQHTGPVRFHTFLPSEELNPACTNFIVSLKKHWVEEPNSRYKIRADLRNGSNIKMQDTNLNVIFVVHPKHWSHEVWQWMITKITAHISNP